MPAAEPRGSVRTKFKNRVSCHDDPAGFGRNLLDMLLCLETQKVGFVQTESRVALIGINVDLEILSGKQSLNNLGGVWAGKIN